jgi:pyruvate, water dikinase
MRLALALAQVEQPRWFGGKAVGLGQAIRAGLPVPAGHGLSVALVDALADGSSADRRQVTELLAELVDALAADPTLDRFAVRSSATDEDSAAASFAGQHRTLLNVAQTGLTEAIDEVWASGRTPAALGYRARLGLSGTPAVAVVVQRMIRADCAGVLFTRDPVAGADRRVIEAAWGLGEAVVAGLVDPDRVVMARGGRVLDHHVGNKDLAVELVEHGTREVAVAPTRACAPCLDADRLAALEALAGVCEAVFDGPSDIEWAFEGDRLHLLQRRAVTR